MTVLRLILTVLVVLLTSHIDAQAEVQTKASWYSEKESRQLTASGVALHDERRTCASWMYPFGTTLTVRHGNRSVKVTVVDRGPSWSLVAKGRTLDLSVAAFKALAPLREGVIVVWVKRVEVGGQ